MANELVNMDQLVERVRAACRMVPEKDSQFRRLETRSRDEYDPKSGWQIRVEGGSPDVYAVELAPCGEDAEGSVLIQRHSDENRIRTDAGAMYDLWHERLPLDALR